MVSAVSTNSETPWGLFGLGMINAIGALAYFFLKKESREERMRRISYSFCAFDAFTLHLRCVQEGRWDTAGGLLDLAERETDEALRRDEPRVALSTTDRVIDCADAALYRAYSSWSDFVAWQAKRRKVSR